MARTPPPPGPPPAHYRPPGSPRQDPPLPVIDRGTSTTAPPPRRPSRWAPAVALVVAVLGTAVVFAVWRSADDTQSDEAATTSTSTSSTLATGDTISPNAPTTQPPPGTELDPDVIGTVENPIPIGEPYVLGVFEVTVHGADLDAYDTLDDYDSSNPTPADGFRRVLVDVTIRFAESSGFVDTAHLPFEVRRDTDVWTDIDAGCGNVPDSILNGFLLGAGEEARGNLCFTVPDDAVEELLLTTDGFAGPVYFALR